MSKISSRVVSISQSVEFGGSLAFKVRSVVPVEHLLEHQLDSQSASPEAQSGLIFLIDQALAERMADFPARKIVVLRKNSPTCVARWLDLGFDDVLTFDCDPLIWGARLRKLEKAPSSVEEDQEIGPLRLNHGQQRAYCLRGSDWMPVDLTSLEFRVLRQLCRHPGSACSRRDLHQAIWGGDVHLSLRNIDTHVCKLRQKIDHPEVTIESSRGLGYRLMVRRSLPEVPENLPFRGIA